MWSFYLYPTHRKLLSLSKTNQAEVAIKSPHNQEIYYHPVGVDIGVISL